MSELREPFSDHNFWGSETVHASRDIQVLFPVGIRDNELSQLRAKYLMVNSPFVTSYGIAQLIKQWLKGSREIDRIDLEGLQSLNINTILGAIGEATVMSWNNLLRKWKSGEIWNNASEANNRVGIESENGLLMLLAESGKCIVLDTAKENV
ncbi:hypothetical protein OESDEN_20964 [Oesophagostomum dentatum]|uniref:Uncharacterized protein n=1 Tax=Oesophagostomum dentatum TaxID=61180 RepID=A0A0B1S824_OESDE|nr:hypothetical protein OESDEN_20964 [Oesophagostomum dentatum]